MSMASVVHLVRHGEVENPDQVVYADLPGFNLSRRGRRQAGWAGTYLSPRPIEAVYSSPLDRAMETASVIAAHHDSGVVTVPDLTEWALLGRWRGLRWSDLDAHYPGELDVYLTRPPAMDFAPESVEDLAVRLSGAISSLSGHHLGSEIVVVSHQDPLQAARLSLTGQPLDRLHEVKPRHCEVISLIPGTPWMESARRVPNL